MCVSLIAKKTGIVSTTVHTEDGHLKQQPNCKTVVNVETNLLNIHYTHGDAI